jgi:hypothetical protein
MARYITLNLVNAEGVVHVWPGTPTQHEIGTQISARAVWIGVSADGNSNQVYPLTASPAAILASWARLYQGVQINTLVEGDDSPGEVQAGEFVYYVSLEEFNRLEAACCVASSIQESPASPILPPCFIELYYMFENGAAGSLVITADGDEILNTTENGQGAVYAPAGSDVVITVTGSFDNNITVYQNGSPINSVNENPGPAVLNIDDVECGQTYAIIAQTSGEPPM